MTQIIRIVQASLVNAVTVYGVFGAHWTVATAIALYWSENVLTIFFLAMLFLLYRAGTDSVGSGELGNFLEPSVAFTIAHGIFLAVVLLLLFPKIAPTETLDTTTFLVGVGAIAALMLFNFLVDVSLARFTPFAEIRSRSQLFMGRVVVVHLTIFLGMGAMAIFGHVRALFAVFAGLKLLSDFGSRRGERLAAA